MIESELIRLEGIAATVVSKRTQNLPESRRFLAARIVADRLDSDWSRSNRLLTDGGRNDTDDDGTDDTDDTDDTEPESASDLVERWKRRPRTDSTPRAGGSASFSGPAPPRSDPEDAVRSGSFRRYRNLSGSIVTETDDGAWLSIETNPEQEPPVSIDLGIHGIEAGATLDTASARSIGEGLLMAVEELEAMEGGSERNVP